jgi:hypothetical protein
MFGQYDTVRVIWLHSIARVGPISPWNTLLLGAVIDKTPSLTCDVMQFYFPTINNVLFLINVDSYRANVELFCKSLYHACAIGLVFTIKGKGKYIYIAPFKCRIPSG